MGKTKRKKGTGENGLTLVEVLASIVILTLLLTTFLMLFLQAAKVNKASEHIIDATYLAQTEMENIYAKSNNKEFNNVTLESLGYKLTSSQSPSISEDAWITYEKVYASGRFEIEFNIEKNEEFLKRIVLDVYEDGIHRARMQHVLVWRTESQ